MTRLLQNPLGQVAPEGQRGDLVRITDGHATVYMDPAEFDVASEAQLRDVLAAKVVPEPPHAAHHAPPGAGQGTRRSSRHTSSLRSGLR